MRKVLIIAFAALLLAACGDDIKEAIKSEQNGKTSVTILLTKHMFDQYNDYGLIAWCYRQRIAVRLLDCMRSHTCSLQKGDVSMREVHTKGKYVVRND